jgi:DNA primase
LSWLNVPQEEIERINLESLRHKSISGILESRQTIEKPADIQFEERDLPTDTQELSAEAIQYLTRRSISLDYPFLFKDRPRPGIIIPFTHNNQVVGNCTRFLDDRVPKYLNDMQPGYVFGTDLQRDSWQSVLVMEGVFDALSIGGLAVLHAEINDAQVRLIRGLDREVIVVPDQDAAGMRLVDRAVELGWSVSMPNWPADVKDVNDAVIRWGRLTTLLTILQARETSRIKIELRKKQLVKQFK